MRETSSLVATLVTLLCSDELDDIEVQFTAEHFQNANYPRHRTSSDISVVDIRSYRYHCLVDDFPILQRHLLAYIIPLAGADNPEISHSGEPILKFVTNVIDEDVKLCLFSLHNSLQFLNMLHSMAVRLSHLHKWKAMIPVMRSIPESVVTLYPHLQLLHDFVVSCWVRESSLVQKPEPGTVQPSFSSVNEEAKFLYYLRKFYSSETQARMVLSVCDGLPVDIGMDLLNLCLSQPVHSQLWSAVADKHQYLSMYSRVSMYSWIHLYSILKKG